MLLTNGVNVIRNFNDILSPTEKKERNDTTSWLMNGFWSAVLDSGLTYVHMEGVLIYLVQMPWYCQRGWGKTW